MSDGPAVRICPHCADHPAYVESALQCGPCGALRPNRVVEVHWRGGSTRERILASDALDVAMNSDGYKGAATAVLEWVSERSWRVVEAEALSPVTFRTGPIFVGQRSPTPQASVRKQVEDALSGFGLVVAPNP